MFNGVNEYLMGMATVTLTLKTFNIKIKEVKNVSI